MANDVTAPMVALSLSVDWQSIMNSAYGMNDHMMDANEIPKVEMIGEDRMTHVEQGGCGLNGVLWQNLPDGLDMNYDDMTTADYDDDSIIADDSNYKNTSVPIPLLARAKACSTYCIST